jgi:hypothetical protein
MSFGINKSGASAKAENRILLDSTQPTTSSVESGGCAGFGTKVRFSQMQEFRKIRKRECPLKSAKVWPNPVREGRVSQGTDSITQRGRWLNDSRFNDPMTQ